jgi:hypothetical protein
MPLIYRSMLIEGGKPKVGAEARCLGVRVPPDHHADIPVDTDGNVAPATGGMSVAPSLEVLGRVPFLVSRRLRHRFPRARGVDDLVCWRLGEGTFAGGSVGPGLILRPDPANSRLHGFVEPEVQMPLAQYQQALAATRDAWQCGEA